MSYNKISHAALLVMTASLGMASAQTSFMISNVHSKLVLDVPGSSKTEGAAIQQATPNGAANQLWVLHRPGQQFYYEIRSVNSGMVIDVPASSTQAGTALQQYPANGGNNQLWQFVRGGGSTGYEIISANLEPLKGAAGTLQQYAPLAFDVPHSSTAAGTSIQQFTENNGTNQQWLLHQQASSTMLVSATETSITLTGWNFAPSTEVCPVLQANGGVPATAMPCAMTTAAGSFTTVLALPDKATLNSEAPGYVVVVLEDKNQNVLAIGSVAGILIEYIP